MVWFRSIRPIIESLSTLFLVLVRMYKKKSSVTLAREHLAFLLMFFGVGFMLLAGVGGLIKLSLGAFDLVISGVGFVLRFLGSLIGLSG